MSLKVLPLNDIQIKNIKPPDIKHKGEERFGNEAIPLEDRLCKVQEVDGVKLVCINEEMCTLHLVQDVPIAIEKEIEREHETYLKIGETQFYFLFLHCPS
jgi:hypothetical protein